MLAVAAGLSGCGGSEPAAKPAAKPSAVPAPAPPGTAKPTATPAHSTAPAGDLSLAPDGAPEASPVTLKYPVGPWLEWQVAQSQVVRGKAYLRLTAVAGRAAVVELFSYDAPQREEFPSLYVRATTTATSIRGLAGQTLDAEIFLQVERDGNMLHSRPGQRVELRVTGLDGSHIRGTFAGQVYDIETDGAGPIRGAFQAVNSAGQ
jgi:hypothetical protein